MASVAYISVDGSDVLVTVRDADGTLVGTTKIAETPYDIDSINLGFDEFGHVIVSGPESDTWVGSGGVTSIFWIIDTTDMSILFSSDVDEGTPFTYTLPFTTVIDSSREHTLAIVAGGTIKLLQDGTLSTPTDGADALDDTAFGVMGTYLYGKFFFVDGTDFKFVDIDTETPAVEVVVADEGTAPVGGRLIARYRGRLVVSGVEDDPHNWFMSATGDPFDWDYGPEVITATQAVAGNLSEAGLIGDVVTALVPYSDDIMIFGCDNSVWLMANDPAAGGSIDLVTDQIGMAWGASWAKDPNGLVYFVGTDGVYRMVPGQKPESITAGRLDVAFQALDLENRRAMIGWDSQRRGLLLSIVPAGTMPPQQNYFYDVRADAWNEESFANNIGPAAMLAYDTDRPEDKTLLIGGKDGYLREFVDADEGDDGAAITSRVRSAVIPPANDDREQVLIGVRVNMAATSGPAFLRIFTGQTAEDCVTAPLPRFTKPLTAGTNAFSLPRVMGQYVQLEITGTGVQRWAVENMTVTTIVSGKKKRHRR